MATTVGAFFGIARWSDFLTAAGTLLGLLPLTIAVVYRRPIPTIVFYLFVSGWILPSIYPPYAVAFGKSEFGNADYYIVNIYLGEVGYFSRGVTLEHTWEGSHGHTWPIGSWIPGYLLSGGLLVAGGVVLCQMPRASTVVVCVAGLSYSLIVAFAFRSFASDGWWLCSVAATFCAVYLIFGASFCWRVSRHGECGRLRKFAGLALLFYPWWVLTLAISHGVFPFLGWLSTFVACTLLLFGPESWFMRQDTAALPMLVRLRMLLLGS